jgi:ribonuclease HII
LKKENAKRQEQLLQHDRQFLDQGVSSLAGVDEAGRGPLAGPVVASAVIVRDFSFSCRIDDSKKMSASAREKAYTEILQKCWVGLGVVECQVIDHINIFQASLRAMEEAVAKLERTPDCVLVDGPAMAKLPFRQVPVINGDAKSFSIACASIVAKVTRDRMMEYYDGLYPGYGFAKHKGYGTREHVEALKIHGPCRIHRRTFEPVKSMGG